MEEIEENNSYYTLLLRFFHPSIDPEDITKQINLEPNLSWKAGEQAKTPAGTILSHARKQSYWCYDVYTENKLFSAEVAQIISYLSPHQDFLHRIVSEGGRVEIYLQLPGSVNVGDTIPLEILTKLVDLKIDLSIEVFPDMR